MKIFTNKQHNELLELVNDIDLLVHSYPSENSFNDIMNFSEVESKIKLLKFILEGNKFKYDKN